jgi:hypothetical protein
VDTESSQQPQGPEGRQLHLKADEAFRHWGERAEFIIATIDLFIAGGDEDDDEELSYVSVPPKRTIYVRTRYVFRGKGKPRPFELEDE